MPDMILKHNEKLDVREILKDLDKYEPRRHGWVWRKPAPGIKMGPFEYKDCSEPLSRVFHYLLLNISKTSTHSHFQLSQLKSLQVVSKTISEE